MCHCIKFHSSNSSNSSISSSQNLGRCWPIVISTDPRVSTWNARLEAESELAELAESEESESELAGHFQLQQTHRSLQQRKCLDRGWEYFAGGQSKTDFLWFSHLQFGSCLEAMESLFAAAGATASNSTRIGFDQLQRKYGKYWQLYQLYEQLRALAEESCLAASFAFGVSCSSQKTWAEHHHQQQPDNGIYASSKMEASAGKLGRSLRKSLGTHFNELHCCHEHLWSSRQMASGSRIPAGHAVAQRHPRRHAYGCDQRMRKMWRLAGCLVPSLWYGVLANAANSSINQCSYGCLCHRKPVVSSDGIDAVEWNAMGCHHV